MLVLERRSGETVLIFPEDGVNPNMTVGELFAKGPIEVTVRHRDNGSTRLAIRAPASIKILRGELAER